MKLLEKLNALGRNLQRILFKEEYEVTSKIRDPEFERKHKNMARLNRLIDNWRGLLTLFLIFYMLGFLYIALWYAGGTIRENIWFHPVTEYCKSNYTDTFFVERTSDFTQTKCYNPYAAQICPPSEFCIYTPEYQGGLEVNSSGEIR